MIKANELRRGNWLTGTKPVQVDQILSDSDVGIASGGNPYTVYADKPFKPCLNPIELTPEILEAAGFNRHYYENAFILNGNVIEKLEWEDDDNITITEWRFSRILNQELYYFKSVMPNIKYLHTLQNLYFALTGKELEINL